MPLRAHFLNVGSGDCTIVEFPSGRIGIIDINNCKVLDPSTREEVLEAERLSLAYVLAPPLQEVIREQLALAKAQEKLTDPLTYFDANIGRKRDIFRLFVTHPDMDHMSGLYRLHKQDSEKSILNFWHTGNHDFNLAETSDDEWEKCPYDKRDWETYKELRSGSGVTALQKYQHATGEFWTDDGIEILAPTKALEKMAVEKEEPNILSMVLKITYKGKAFLFGGDATGEETWPAITNDIDLSNVWVLKASHHGRKTGYYQPAVKAMAPWLTITSVGSTEHDATPNYRRYSNKTVSLRDAGDIRITIEDDGRVLYSPNAEEYWKDKTT